MDEIEKDFNEIQEEEKEIKKEGLLIERRVRIFSCLGWFFVIGGAIFGSIGVYFQLKSNQNVIKFHEIGDFIGGTVASLWALSGLFFIYVAFLGQQKQMLFQILELKFSRFEVRTTRYELEGQKKQMIEQNNSIKLQRFENIFFNMISILHEIVNNIDLVQKENIVTIKGRSIIEQLNQSERKTHFSTIKGKDCFVKFYDDFKEFFSEHYNLEITELENIRFCFGEFSKKNSADLIHYLNQIYQISLIIERADVKNKKEYVDILMSQLSTSEIYLIFYASLQKGRNPYYLKFFKKYTVLNGLNKEMLIKDEHYNLYDPKVYKI